MTSSNKLLLMWAYRIFDLFVWLLTALFLLWSLGAIYYLSYVPVFVRICLVVVFGIAVPICWWYSEPKTKARAYTIACCCMIYLATLLVRPTNDRNWAADHTKVADVSIEDGVVTIDNFRLCKYRSEIDFDTTFASKQFSIQSIESVWFLVQKFSPSEGMAHVFLSFGLKNDEELDYFSVSVEIRREKGESYTPLRGLFRTYELTHVIGDERDLVGVRTVFRPNDRVFMYRVNATPAQAQDLFVQFAQRIRSLRSHPQFYHTLLNNCANGITGLTYELTPAPINWLDSRIVLPGYSAEFAFENGLIGKRTDGQTFDELQSFSRIDTIARKFGISEIFSKNIRSKIQF